jgi:hypothetical protein
MKRANDPAGRPFRSIQIVITKIHFCKTPRFTGKKKVYFSLSGVLSSAAGSSGGMFRTHYEFTLAAKFLFGTAIYDAHGAVRLGYREARRLSDHAKSLTFLM